MKAEPDSSTSARPRRLWPWILLTAFVLFLVVVTAVIFYRVELAERAATRWLRSAGLDTASVTVEAIGLNSIRLRDLSLGGEGPSFESAEVTYTPGDLLKGRLGSIKVGGLSATLRIEDDGVQVEGLPPMSPGGGSQSGLPSLPFESVVLEDFSLRVPTPLGPAELSGNATVEPNPEGSVDFSADVVASGDPGSLAINAAGQVSQGVGETIRVRADLEGSAEAAQADTRFAGTLQLTSDGGDIDGHLSLRDAEISHGEAGAAGLAGDVRFELVSGAIASAEADLRLSSGRLAGTEIGRSGVQLAYQNGRLAATLDLSWAGGALQAEIQPVEGRSALPYTFDLEGAVEAGWLASLVTTVEANGRVRLSLAGQIVDPVMWFSSGRIDPAALLEVGRIDGEVALDLEAIRVPELGSANRITGTLGVSLADQQLEVRALRELVAEQVSLHASVKELVPAALGHPAGAPLTVSVGKSGPANLKVGAKERGAVGEANLNAVVTGSGTTVSLEVTANSEIDSEFSLEDLTISRVAMSASGLTVAGLATDGTIVATGLTVTPQAVRGDAEIMVSLGGQPIRDVRIREAGIEAQGAFELTDDRLAFVPAGEAHVRIARLDAGPVRTAAPVALAVSSGEKGKPIIIDFSNGISASLQTGPIDLRLAVTRPDRLSIRFSARSLRVNADSGVYAVFLSGARILDSEHELSIGGLAAKATLRSEGSFTARIDAAEVKHLGAPAWVVPLKLAANVQGTLRRITFNGELFDPSRRLVAKTNGTHSLATGAGEARLELQPISFIPTVLQLRQLFPAAYQLHVDLDARLSATAQAEWGPHGLRSSGTIDANITELSTGELELREVATILRFDSLAPPSTLPRQLMTIGELNVGLPLTDGLIRMELHPDLRVTGVIDQLRLFGGSIRTEPFEIDPEAPVTEVSLQVEQIDLAQFLAFAEFGEIEATGTLHGTIPIVIANGEVSVRDAVLETAEEGGILKYRPSGVAEALEVANAATETLIKAVQNFRYSKIRVYINETSAEEMTFRLVLEGRSPDVYEGLPLQLNVNISGPLKDILSRGLKTYQLPAELGRELQERAQ